MTALRTRDVSVRLAARKAECRGGGRWQHTYQSRILAQVCCHTRLLSNIDSERSQDEFRVDLLCDVQKVVPIHQSVIYGLVNVWAYTTCVDHGASLLLCLGIEQVVAL
jgi:hypothetical protein